jgi:hypothetical protein
MHAYSCSVGLHPCPHEASIEGQRMPGDLPSPVWSVGCSGGGGRRPATWISSAVSLVPLIVPTGVTAHTLVRTSGRGRLAEDRSDGASRPGGGHYFVRKIGSSSTPPLPPETQRMPTRMSACRGANLPLPLSVTRCKAGKPRTSARGNTLASLCTPSCAPSPTPSVGGEKVGWDAPAEEVRHDGSHH